MAREVRVAILGDARGFERSVHQANRALGGLGSRFDSVIGRMAKRSAIGLGTGVIAVLGAATKSIADFDSTMNTLGVVSSATAAEMSKVKDVAVELGKDMSLPGTSASDAAEAMTELAKGGLNVTEAMDAAKGVLQLSAAAQIENAEAATIASQALNSFNLDAKDSVRVSDLLAAAANASSAEITDVALAMQQASAVYASAHVPIEDLTTAIGLMANAGVRGSDAGTSLKTMLTRVLAPASEKARGALRKLGVDVYNADGQFVGMRKTIEKFGAALKGMNQEQRNAALNTIFGSDAIRAANIILGDGARSWDEMSKAVTRQGAAGDVAAAKMKGVGGAIEGLKSVLETLVLELGMKVGPSIEKATRWLSGNLPAAVDAASVVISELTQDVLGAFSRWWDENGETAKQVASDVFGSISGFAMTVGTVIRDDLMPPLVAFGDWMLTEGPGVEIAIAGLTAAMAAYAVSALIAAGSTVVATWPFWAFAVAVGGLTWATNELWDTFELGPKASAGIQWVIDNAVGPFVIAIGELIDQIETLLGLVSRLPNPGSSKGVRDLSAGLLEGQQDAIRSAPRLHSGGMFRTSAGGGEGLAILRDGERVLTPEQQSSGGGINLTINGNLTRDLLADAMHELRKVRLAASL